MFRLFLVLSCLAAFLMVGVVGCGGSSSDGADSSALLAEGSSVLASSDVTTPGGPLEPAAETTAMASDGGAIAALAVGQAGDTVAPTIVAPPDIRTGPVRGTLDLGVPEVSDNADANPTVTNDAPLKFKSGITQVTWTATDAAGNSATAVQTVEIDARAPKPGGRPH